MPYAQISNSVLKRSQVVPLVVRKVVCKFNAVFSLNTTCLGFLDDYIRIDSEESKPEEFINGSILTTVALVCYTVVMDDLHNYLNTLLWTSHPLV